ncbi:AraC family transcriptional regulator [Vibrio profundum]|uniref:AraC family ligand binding domain-containing protein n=1 Tax=Vibrio profundum TaxID=2910247 RepID=UPI003D0A4F73
MDNIHYCTTAYPGVNLIDANYKKFAFQRHYHLDYHIGLITQGRQKFRYRGVSYQAGSGDVVIIPPDEIHDGQSVLDSGYQVRVLAITPEWLSRLVGASEQAIPQFRQLVISQPNIQHRLQLLHQSLDHSLDPLALDCALYEHVPALLCHNGERQYIESHRLGTRLLEQIKEFARANLDQPIQLDQLAALCQLSTNQFQRQFSRQVGLSPYAWLTRLRLETSLKLLKSGATGSDVAVGVGFFDQAHFCKTFKRHYGITPSQVAVRSNSFVTNLQSHSKIT